MKPVLQSFKFVALALRGSIHLQFVAFTPLHGFIMKLTLISNLFTTGDNLL